MTRTARIAGLLVALVLRVAACDGASTDETVSVTGFRFDPPQLTVAVGDTVTWTNGDAIDHTATAGTPDDPDGTFAVPLPEEGATGDHTFTEAGTFAYFCEIHESMQGEIVVE